ncbi:MAG: YjzD family protein [Streptococcaceae bacterium]|jgi:uncharacterized protein YacL|nr:YjzD family protein [Streptococcaceae bacterium]
MKYAVITFWALVLGQVVGYIVASLAGVKDIPFLQVALLSLVVEGIVLAIIHLSIPKSFDEKEEHHSNH